MAAGRVRALGGGGRLGLAALVALVCLGAVGCGATTRELRTSRFALTHPDYWQVKNVGQQDGAASIVTIGQYGDAVIDDAGRGGGSYETVQAEIEVRLYGWAPPAGMTDPTRTVAGLLAQDPELALPRAMPVLESPPECGQFKRKFTMFGQPQEPLDLVRRPGHRTIVVGGAGEGHLVGVVARVPYEQDMGRYCHNLRNMRVQLQTLLDGMRPPGTAPTTGPPPPAPQ